MSGSVRQIAFSAICAFGASTFFTTVADAQALRAETTEVAAAATQSSAAACIHALDRPVVDPALLVRRCTGYKIGRAHV